jgi:heat shock protein HslJ
MSGRSAGVVAAFILLSTALRPLVALAQAQTPGQPETLPEALTGTVWRLVEFRSSDDGIGRQRPEDPSLYTMSLETNGVVTMNLDCNRATGTWTATTIGGSFGFGALRMTRVVCRQPSLDAQIARHAEYVSSFLLRDGLLHLNLVADGGTYVWERLRE